MCGSGQEGVGTDCKCKGTWVGWGGPRGRRLRKDVEYVAPGLWYLHNACQKSQLLQDPESHASQHHTLTGHLLCSGYCLEHLIDITAESS